MTIGAFLAHLQSNGVRLWVEGENLCYSTPHGLATADVAAQLAQRKAEILRVMRMAKAAASSISRASRVQALPASFAQQRLWFTDQLTPDRKSVV